MVEGAKELCRLSLEEADMLRHKPSEVAAASVVVAWSMATARRGQKVKVRSGIWNEGVENWSGMKK